MWQDALAEFQNTFSVVPVGAAMARLLTAVVLGGLIGIEREWRHKPAGLRTHILVCVAACLFVILGLEISQLDFGQDDQQRQDPLRMIEAVTAGVAFLAAGLIFTAKGQVKNVTTGASLWLAGAVGLGCGAGQMPLAALATGIVVSVIFLLRQLERLWGTH
ncbi:MAG: MgtC/SapB family protein [Marinovum algicola]|jgi:putative Mg2+ transporter-C (MgtC) family protein|uniref:Protein MgtC n=1 Tax=Marinovum algicola TaxID=42444 RepID=A0A975ZMB2_9RHOB|nr:MULTISPECIES: MgtC/SapB family protein [Marinovum]AKO96230.1 putative membrane protein [Marinovum algicola DG 898]MDD9738710.1 MgtC/SapB family protein [Marinovum sp. SP66]MDD9746115.1 MgtC/SapB family protein [Marinovum sp. PR37]SEI95098.1 putative Mg2+ transporter-C (MgtC) family protein [Marinovum algicola]SLN10634.1 putative Mg(2+) transport ATPase [Marinovum algicola]